MPLVRAEHTGVRVRSHQDFGFHRQGLLIEHPDFLVRLVADVKLARFGVNGDTREEALLTHHAHLH